MVNKLRDVMGKRDDVYTLEGAIELDDAFFSMEISPEDRDKPSKRGRGSQKKDQSISDGESMTVEKPKAGQIHENVSDQRFNVRCIIDDPILHISALQKYNKFGT